MINILKSKQDWVSVEEVGGDAVANFFNLLNQLGVPYTQSVARQELLSHPDFPSLYAFLYLLPDWGVDATLYETENDEDVTELTTPCMTNIASETAPQGNGYFVVVVKRENGVITYIDPFKGWVSEAEAEFVKKWKKKILVATPTGKKSEPHYAQNQAKERHDKILDMCVWSGLLIFIVVTTYCGWRDSSFQLVWTGETLLKLVGLGLSAVLIRGFVEPSSFVKSCPNKGNLSCVDVMNSPAATIKGIPFSVIGGFYFTTGYLALLAGVWSGAPIEAPLLHLLKWLNMATLPYTLFSLYYQGIVLKKWCPYCVGVMGVLWLEFLVFLWLPPGDSNGLLSSSGILVLCFIVQAVAWIGLLKPFAALGEVQHLRDLLMRVQNNPERLKGVLAFSPKIEVPQFEGQLNFGSPHAPFSVILIVKPTCIFCGAAVATMKEYLTDFEGLINFRVLLFAPEEDKPSQDIAKTIGYLTLQEGNGKATEAFYAWFLEKNKNNSSYLNWLSRYPVDPNTLQDPRYQTPLANVAAVLKNSTAEGISPIEGIPAVIVNGALLKDGLSLNHLRYLLREQQES